jgi:8-oxo-dGTP diphosphatase
MIKCTFENGSPAVLRHTCVQALVVKDQQILLVKRSPNLSEGNKWAIPGGYLDLDETTSQAALRELLEETGYAGKIIALFQIIDNPQRRNEDKQNVSFTFLIEVGQKVADPDQESTAVKWFNLDNLPAQDEFAFDHLNTIHLYQQYLHNQTALQLPVLK